MRSAVLLLLCGCVKLAGIEDTSGDGLVGLTLSVERTSIGSTIVRAPLDLSENTAQYLIVDELDPTNVTRVDAVETDVGVWSADIFDATPPVLFDLPEPTGPVFPRLWTFPNQDLFASLDVLEHPNATPLADPAMNMLTVNVTTDVPFTTETYELFIVGAWNFRGLQPPAAATTALMPPPFAAMSMTSLTGRPLEQFTSDDTILIMRRLGTTLAGLLEVPAFDQGVNDTLPGMMTTVMQDQTLSLQINPAAAMTRLSTLPAVGGVTFGWEVRAAPGSGLANGSGPLLVSGTAMMVDTAVSAPYGNPFVDRGWGAVLGWVAQGTRTVTPAGQALPVTLAAGMFQNELDPTPNQVLDFPAGMPSLISFDNTPLSTDTLQIAAPTEPVTISIATEDVPATLYAIDVFELVPNMGGTALDRTRVFNALALEPLFVLPPNVFEAGKIYTIRAVSIVGGFPNIANGDLRTKAFPIASAFLDSGAFRVMP